MAAVSHKVTGNDTIDSLRALSPKDRDDAFKLLSAMDSCATAEEEEEIREALLEILTHESMTSSPLASAGDRPERLDKWVRHVGTTIKRLRESRFWTQADLAKRAGLSDQAHVSRIESGQISPSRRTIERIALALGVSIGTIDPTDE